VTRQPQCDGDPVWGSGWLEARWLYEAVEGSWRRAAGKNPCLGLQGYACVQRGHIRGLGEAVDHCNAFTHTGCGSA